MRRVIGKILHIAVIVIAWAAVAALVCVPAVFLNTVYGYLPALMLVLLLLVSAVSLFAVSRSLSVETECTDVQCERGESVDVGLKLVNHSILSCPRATAYLYISDLFGKNDSVRTVRFSIGCRATVDFSFAMEMTHIGCYSIGLDHVEVWDFLGLFRRKVPVSGRFTATVTPHRRAMDGLMLDQDAAVEASRETKISVVGGTDYTGVRAYALGDPMKQIHWKLSAHTREYVTKLQESNFQQEFSVLLDFSGEKNDDHEQLMDLNDCLIETALSLVSEVTEQYASCSLLYSDKSHTVTKVMPSGQDDDVELIRSFAGITPAPGAEFPDACSLLQEEAQASSRSSNVLLVTSQISTDLVHELIRTKQQRRSPELWFVVPAEWSERELETARRPLKQLDDADIPYFTVSTAVNQAAIN
ncbi:MAG: DUF58 domain-containing protein [Oscillospiraceae bacterium]